MEVIDLVRAYVRDGGVREVRSRTVSIDVADETGRGKRPLRDALTFSIMGLCTLETACVRDATERERNIWHATRKPRRVAQTRTDK